MLGFIGLGDMGLPIARRLLASGQAVVAWNRSEAKLDALVADGAIAAATPREVMARADVIGICLTSHLAVEEVGWGSSGMFSIPPTRRKFVADLSTGSPDSAISFARRAATHGVTWVDTPFTGGVAAATAGKLVFFAGGDEQSIAAVNPLLAPLAARVTCMGPVGMGQVTKLCNNALGSCMLLLIAETIALARKAKLDVTRFAEALKGGAPDNQYLQVFGPRMAEHQFEPRLGAIALIEKDIALISDMSAAHGAYTPILSLVRELYAAARQEPTIDVMADVSCLIGLFEPITRGAIPQ
jgi:3-hydroxyisobutyrate dehydrogenase